MKIRKTIYPKKRNFEVLFLLWEEEKVVCIWLSFSQTPEIELRKYWISLTSAAESLLTEDISPKKPDTLMWKVGSVQREVGVYALEKWKSSFLSHGYRIIGKDDHTLLKKSEPKLTRQEENILREISADMLLNRKARWHVACNFPEQNKKPPTEKFTADVAQTSLCIRVTEEIAKEFRYFCRDNVLTQSQAIASLLDTTNGNKNLLANDLTERLNIAEERLRKTDQEMKHLRNALENEKQGKDYPKKYRAAQLQNELLLAFFNRISAPENLSMLKLQRCSPKISERTFSNRKEYTYPEHEGVVFLFLDHIAYGKSTYAPLFIYGRDTDGNQKKIRWYYKRPDHFGVSMWDSPFLLAGAPWLFAVQKAGDVADVVGSLPVIDVNWSNIRTMEDILALQDVIEDRNSYIAELEEALDSSDRTDSTEDNEDAKNDDAAGTHLPLDEVIRHIQKNQSFE